MITSLPEEDRNSEPNRQWFEFFLLDYMSRKNMIKTAEILKEEAKLPDHPPGPIPDLAICDADEPDGFLQFWWSIFSDIFVNGNNDKAEGSQDHQATKREAETKNQRDSDLANPPISVGKITLNSLPRQTDEVGTIATLPEARRDPLVQDAMPPKRASSATGMRDDPIDLNHSLEEDSDVDSLGKENQGSGQGRPKRSEGCSGTRDDLIDLNRSLEEEDSDVDSLGKAHEGTGVGMGRPEPSEERSGTSTLFDLNRSPENED